MATISTVIFDYYETLAQLPHDGRERMMDGIAKAVGYESPPGQPWKEWTEQPSDLKLRFAGGSSTRPAVNGEPPPFRTFWDYWKERFEELFQSWDVDARGELGADAYTEHHIKAVVYPEVKDTLRELGRDCRLAVLSNADDAFLQGSLAKNALTFETVVSSEELRVYKPHVSTFRASLYAHGNRASRGALCRRHAMGRCGRLAECRHGPSLDQPLRRRVAGRHRAAAAHHPVAH